MKLLLIHTPKAIRHERRIVEYEIMALAHGLLPLAALARDAGHQVTVLHLGLEQQDPDFDLQAEVRAMAPQVVGLSLQWHAQLAAGLEAAAAVKAAAPGTPVLAGGVVGVAPGRTAAAPRDARGPGAAG
jgi:hypothetical protein